MQETEVTQEQYLAVMDTNPAKFKGDLRRPVETVNWEDAVKFCNTLSKLCGLDTVYDIKTWGADFTKKGFRLPTEAEYEYALRGGTTTKYWWGSDTNGIGASAWYFMNTGGTTYPVATKLPNGYKLYDMTGNVDEWCYDWRGPYTKDAAIDPIGPATGTYRILRGDSWTGWDGNIVAANCSAFRTSDNQYVRFPVFGFRVALSR
jgi:formylglycine-generating enzyme required for sulfatase activity